VTRGRRQLTAAFAALFLAAAAAGCGSSNTAAPPTTTAAAAPAATTTTPQPATSNACVPVPAALDKRIIAHVILMHAHFDKTKAARAATVPGYFYVSGLVSGGGAKHMLATWVTHGLEGKREIYSVDANAALISQYGASTGASLELGVDAPGSFRSRTCVAGPKASPGIPAPSSGGGAPAGK
jgi:hypothetical protein